MGKPPLEVLDSDVSEHGIPYASQLKVGDHELAVGDVLAPIDTEDSEGGLAIQCFEEILSFHWKGIITRVYDGPVKAEFRPFEMFVDQIGDSLLRGRFKGESSFRVSEESVRSFKVYQYMHSNGTQYFALILDRPILQENYSEVEMGIYNEVGEMVDEMYREQQFFSVEDAERVYEMFVDVGVREELLPDPSECQIYG